MEQETCFQVSFWEIFTVITRFFGIATAVVLLGIGVDVTFYHNSAGVYIIVGSLLVFFFETAWVVSIFIQICLPYYSMQRWIDIATLWTWPKAILYCFSGCLLLFHPQRLWLSFVGGAMLLILVLLHVTRVLSGCHGKHGILVPTSDDDFITCEDVLHETKVASDSEGEEI